MTKGGPYELIEINLQIHNLNERRREIEKFETKKRNRKLAGTSWKMINQRPPEATHYAHVIGVTESGELQTVCISDGTANGSQAVTIAYSVDKKMPPAGLRGHWEPCSKEDVFKAAGRAMVLADKMMGDIAGTEENTEDQS